MIIENQQNIQLITFKVPEIFSVDYAVQLLNNILNELQENGYSILSVNHEGNNQFIIETRKVI